MCIRDSADTVIVAIKQSSIDFMVERKERFELHLRYKDVKWTKNYDRQVRHVFVVS